MALWARSAICEPDAYVESAKSSRSKPNNGYKSQDLYSSFFFTYYKMTLNDTIYYLNCMAHKKLKQEVVYTIESKAPDDLIEGLPPETSKEIKKGTFQMLFPHSRRRWDLHWTMPFLQQI